MESEGYRINKVLSALSRRAADSAIAMGRVHVNRREATIGQKVLTGDIVTLDGKIVEWESKLKSRDGDKEVEYTMW